MADHGQIMDGMASLDVSENNPFDKLRKCNATSSSAKMKEVFRFFDKDR